MASSTTISSTGSATAPAAILEAISMPPMICAICTEQTSADAPEASTSAICDSNASATAAEYISASALDAFLSLASANRDAGAGSEISFVSAGAASMEGTSIGASASASALLGAARAGTSAVSDAGTSEVSGTASVSSINTDCDVTASATASAAAFAAARSVARSPLYAGGSNSTSSLSCLTSTGSADAGAPATSNAGSSMAVCLVSRTISPSTYWMMSSVLASSNSATSALISGTSQTGTSITSTVSAIVSVCPPYFWPISLKKSSDSAGMRSVSGCMLGSKLATPHVPTSPVGIAIPPSVTDTVFSGTVTCCSSV